MMAGFEMWLAGVLMGAVVGCASGISIGRGLERDDNREVVAEALGMRKGIEIILSNSKIRREL